MRDRSLTYFISDIHLGASYIADQHEHERRVVRWLDEVVSRDAARLYLLGDVMDYWWEYRTVVPRGHTRFLGALARLADSGVAITWLKGNHDIWINDYLPDEIGMRVVDGELIENIGNHTFFMEHGDGVGHLPWSFRLLRRLFRNPLAQALYGAVHPRWTIGLAHGWSSHSRRRGGYLADAAADDTSVIRPLRDFATDYEQHHPGKIDWFVFGHVHRTADEKLPGGARMVVLGDWITRFSYGIYDGNSLTLHHF